jgi:Protein of unknown function (DUF3224)
MNRARPRSQRPLAVALTVAALAVAAVGVAGSASTADAQPDPAVRRSTWEYNQSAALLGAPVCSNGRCLIPFSLTGTIDGDGQGSFVQSGSGTLLPGGTLFANSSLIFTGTIADCGSGSVVLTSTGINQAGRTSGAIVIVDGSGTGDLAGLTGRGTVTDGEVAPNGQASGTIAMTLRCERP